MKDKPLTCFKLYAGEQASEEVFQNPAALEQKLNELLTIVDNNDMVGVQTFERGLSNDRLVSQIRAHRIRFGGRVSAAYHIFKHGTDPPAAYVDLANSTVRAPSGQYTVAVGQEGDTRLITFRDANGTCMILESNGRVLLCSFRATGSS